MNFYQHSPEQINQLADALEDPDLDMKGLGWKAAFHLRELQARIADLEAQLYAIGAGGVGQSTQPPVQPDTAAQKPVAILDIRRSKRTGELESWGFAEKPNDAKSGTYAVYTAPQPTENLRCKSTQKRLATLWGYVKQDLARQPLTDEQIVAVADKSRAAEAGDAGYILPISFARAIEEACGITGGQQ